MKNLCHNEEMLADYLEGRLSDNARSQMENHLSICENCLQELMIGKDLILGGDQNGLAGVPDEVTESAVRRLSSLNLITSSFSKERLTGLLDRFYLTVSNLFNMSAWRELHLAPVRSSKKVISKDLMYLKKSFQEINTEIEIEKTGDHNSCIRVRVSNNIKGVRVTLLQKNEREISSQLLNGNDAVFEEIPFGHYRLVFTRDGLKVGIYRFVTKETSYGRR